MVELRTQSQPNPIHKPQIFIPPPFDPSFIQEISFKSMYTNSDSSSHSNRFAKARRNSSHRKPPPPSLSSSYDPFRSEKIDEKMGRWNPFVPSDDPGRPRVSFGTNFDAGKPFVFGSGSGNLGSSRESSLGSDEGSIFSNLSNLPDEMRRKLDLRIKKDGNAEAFPGLNPEVTVSSTSFESKGSGAKKSAELNENLNEGSVSKLADEARKLNLNNAGNVGESSGGGGSSVSSGNKGSGVTGAFVFRSGVEKDVNSSGSNEGLFSKLSDEMRKKMNLNNGDGVEEKKRAENVFVVGSNQNTTGSFGIGFGNKVSENESVGCKEKDVFGSGVKKGADTNEGLFSKLPEEMRKEMNLTSRDGVEEKNRVDSVFVFGSNQSQTGSFGVGIANNELKNESVGCKQKVDGSNGFVFGSSGSAPSFGGSAVDMLHDEMEKMKIGSKMENLAGSFHKSNTGSIPSSPVFTFTGSNMDFKTPNQDASRLTRESLFTGTNQKSTRTKKKKGKLRQSTPFHQSFAYQFVNVESESQDTSGGYSPMDYSPYHEDLVGDQGSREPSVDEREEVLVLAAQRLNIDEGNVSQGGERNLNADSIDEFFFEFAKNSDTSKNENEGFSSNARTTSMEAESNESSVNNERQPSEGGPDNVSFNSSARTTSMESEVNESSVNNGKQASEGGPENVGLQGNARTTPMEAETNYSSVNSERQASEGGHEFTFSASSLDDFGESSFTFNLSPFVPSPLSASKHNSSRKKGKSKSGQNPSGATLKGRVPLASPLPDLIPHNTIGLPDFVGQKSIPSVPQSEDENNTGNIKNIGFSREVRRNSFDGLEAQEACEKWRFRGNQAYAKGYLSRAEDCYTRGINSVPLKEIPRICVEPLTLCFSNRAATRMSLGRMREAISDCKVAVSVDPDFLKAHVRVANCHLALGEIGEALKQFKKCLPWEKDLCTNQKYISEASDGLQKAQQVADLTVQASELLLKKTSSDASRALNMISEALSISPHSESLLEMKAEALLLMRKYEEVIKLCEKTRDLADQNSVMTEAEPQFKNSSPARLWRWRLISKSYFHLGKLEEVLELLQKQEEAKVAVYGDGSAESSTSFAVTIRELLRLKSAGNEAFQESRHLEAVEYYSAALACNAESRPFTAVCFCNRAAAYQALGQITDAIADCSLAIALDPSYPKAISRRATLHEMIRDYGQAANDLNRLMSLHEKQMEGKVNQSGAVGRTTSTCTDLKRARAHFTRVEEEARKEISLNMYMILGIEPSSSAVDVKKAYRKAALRHHPDKAGQFLVRNENIDDGLWREVVSEVHADADRLFKMIGEAYTTLSDPTKRLQYDEEEIRTTTLKRGYYGSTASRSSSDTYNSYYEKNVNRRHWRAQGSSDQRW